MASKEEIVAAIAAKGEEIRVLKTAGADKAALMPHVEGLLQLKADYKACTGEDYVAPGQQGSRKDKQKKKKEGPNEQEKRKEEKEKRRDEKGAKKAAQQPKQAPVADPAVAATVQERTGDLPLIQSSALSDKVYRNVADLTPELDGTNVWLRARVHTSRAVGKGIFLLLRQGMSSVQCIMFANKSIPKECIKYIEGLPTESIVDVRGVVSVAPSPVLSATQSLVELHMEEVHAVNRPTNMLPFQVIDAARQIPAEEAGDQEDKAASTVEEDGKDGWVGSTVKLNTKLDHRWIDLRTPANQAIFRIQSGVCESFRNFLSKRGFVEIHSPKLLGGASEGGANVFNLEYFGSPACLAQSPQLYKQMAAACGGFERVYEIGPVFRAENSNTHRHLCEFTGLDFEMVIKEHYYEVLEVFGELFISIFDHLNSKYAKELESVAQQFPFEPLQYCRPSLRLHYYEGIKLLQEAGYNADPDDDLTTEHEKALGRIVKEKYGTDFFMMDKYPLAIRPFYSMPCPENPKLSNSFDIFIRGEEIVSGAQRIHDVDLLVERAKAWEIPLDTIESYLTAFKHGAEPHGGGGIGLERVVMLFLDLHNIRRASLFPRDPKRIAP